ncbi:MAG: hypothetical protein GF353_15625, partial [Candidatus Lokiarchaeota archaeon]|nr:hypothetical protein [Candidatus Lokiarchaeota archaeon]
MINKELRNNWEQILKFNSTLNMTDKRKSPEKKVRIPLTPIQIDAELLYDLFESLYPVFINDQPNILDIIISDDGKIVKKIYLYETKQAGIHEEYEEIPIDTINNLNLTSLDSFENYDSIFNTIRSEVINLNNLRISSIRVFKLKAIDLINQYCQQLKIYSHKVFIKNLIELISFLFKEKLFFIYPEPNLYTFLKDLFNFCKNIKLQNIFSFLMDILPDGNFIFLINFKDSIFFLKITKNYISKEPEFSIEIIKPKKDISPGADLSKTQLLKEIKEKYNASCAYYLSLDDLKSFFSN